MTYPWSPSAAAREIRTTTSAGQWIRVRRRASRGSATGRCPARRSRHPVVVLDAGLVLIVGAGRRVLAVGEPASGSSWAASWRWWSGSSWACRRAGGRAGRRARRRARRGAGRRRDRERRRGRRSGRHRRLHRRGCGVGLSAAVAVGTPRRIARCRWSGFLPRWARSWDRRWARIAGAGAMGAVAGRGGALWSVLGRRGGRIRDRPPARTEPRSAPTPPAAAPRPHGAAGEADAERRGRTRSRAPTQADPPRRPGAPTSGGVDEHG